MTEKTVKEEIEGVKRRKAGKLKLDFTMVDVPIHLVDSFCVDIRQNYGNIYWAKLMDLMRKAEAYDAMVMQHELMTKEPDENEEEIKLMGNGGDRNV